MSVNGRQVFIRMNEKWYKPARILNKRLPARLGIHHKGIKSQRSD